MSTPRRAPAAREAEAEAEGKGEGEGEGEGEGRGTVPPPPPPPPHALLFRSRTAQSSPPKHSGHEHTPPRQ